MKRYTGEMPEIDNVVRFIYRHVSLKEYSEMRTGIRRAINRAYDEGYNKGKTWMRKRVGYEFNRLWEQYENNPIK